MPIRGVAGDLIPRKQAKVKKYLGKRQAAKKRNSKITEAQAKHLYDQELGRQLRNMF